MYIAGSWFRKHEIGGIRTYLEDRYRSHLHVTSTWLDDPDGPHDTERDMTEKEKRDIAVRDIKDIERSHSLLLLTNGGIVTPGGGRHFELAYAWSLGKMCFVVGKHEHVFMSLPRIYSFQTLEDAVAYFDSIHFDALSLMSSFSINGGTFNVWV